MSVEGRVVLDALVHDRDGAVGMNVVSFTETLDCTGGKVVYLEGTVDESGDGIPLFPSTYRNASGNFVSLGLLSHAVVVAVSGDLIFTRYAADAINQVDTYMMEGDAMIAGLFNLSQSTELQYPPVLRAASGTATYKIMVCGS